MVSWCASALCLSLSIAAIDRLRRSAEQLNMRVAERALRFVLDTPGVDGLIIAPRRVEHFQGLGLAGR